MSSNLPIVSIIIPTFNRKNQLRVCLKSLQEQTFKNFEVLVCDDGSTDNTLEIISEFNSSLIINYIKDTNFGGPARPRNHGILQAKGEIIAFLDSDDWWYPTKLEITVPFLKDYDFVYHDLDVFNGLNKQKRIARGRNLEENIFKDLIINGNAIINSSVLVKKKVVDFVGKITEDKKLVAVEDYDYWIRISQFTNKFKYINKSLGAYREDENISYSVKQVEKLKHVLDTYIDLLNSKEQKQAISNFNFSAARINHFFSLYESAKSFYVKSFGNKKFNKKLLSVIGFLMCVFKINDNS